MAQRDPPAKQQDRAPARNARSPGRRVYNSRLLATRSHIIATNPHMSTAEASRLALNTLGDVPLAFVLCLQPKYVACVLLLACVYVLLFGPIATMWPGIYAAPAPRHRVI